MQKNGFISTALIYSFFLVFLTFMTFLLHTYYHNEEILNDYKIRIKESFIKEDNIHDEVYNENEQ